MKSFTRILVLLLAAWSWQLPAASAQSCAAPTNVSTSSPTASTVVVSFTAAPAVSRYVVRYYWTGDSTAAGIIRRSTTSSPLTLTGLRPASSYLVLVGSICSTNDTIYSVRRLFQTSSPTTAGCAPVTNGHISGPTTSGATVSFTPASGASSYTVSYYAVGDSLNVHTITTSSSSFALGGLAAGTAYRVSIRTNCVGGTTSVPVLLGFRTLTPAIPCGAVSNVVITATSSSTATVSFTPGTGNTSFTITYHLANDSTYRVNTNASPALITGLVPGQTYYVQVVSQCGAGPTVVYTNSTSVPFGFRGAGPLASRNALGTGVLEVYPSPAHDVLNLSVPAVPGASQAQVTLLNALGQPTQTLQLKLAGASTPAQLNLGGVRPGLYVLRIAAGEHTASQRIVVE